jgi:hypothetical protein
MILHLLDDEKFTDTVINQFEEAKPDISIYLIKLKHNCRDIKFVKNRGEKLIFYSETAEPNAAAYLSKLESYDVVVLHNLNNDYKKQIVSNAAGNVKYHWMCWGYDFYNLEKFHDKYLSKSSKDYVRISRNLNWYIGHYFRKVKSNFQFFDGNKHNAITEKKYINLLKSFETVSTVVPNEVAILNVNLGTSYKSIPLKYGHLDSLITTPHESICSGNNFLLGNSATPSGNHIEAFKLLSNLELNAKIFVPLSYGDLKYADYLKREFSKMESGELVYLDKFMNPEDYNKMLLQCGNVIMNHYRQQAMGNILMSLFNGARVFLNTKNPIYSYLKKLGILVFDINSDLKMINELPSFRYLAEYNRPILAKVYSKKVVIEETTDFINFFLKNNK